MNPKYFSEERRNSNQPSQELMMLAMTLKNPALMQRLDPPEAYALLSAVVREGSRPEYSSALLAIGTSKTFEEAVKLASKFTGYTPTEETQTEFENFVYLLLMFYVMKLEIAINDATKQIGNIDTILPARFTNRPLSQ